MLQIIAVMVVLCTILIVLMIAGTSDRTLPGTASYLKSLIWFIGVSLVLTLNLFLTPEPAATRLRLAARGTIDGVTLRYSRESDDEDETFEPDPGLLAIPAVAGIGGLLMGAAAALQIVVYVGTTDSDPARNITDLWFHLTMAVVWLGLGSMSAVSAIRNAYSWGIGQRNAAIAARADAERAGVEALRTRIDPAAMFRAVESVRSLLAMRDPARAERAILDLSSDMRKRLRPAAVTPAPSPRVVAPPKRSAIRDAWRSWRTERSLWMLAVAAGNVVILVALGAMLWPWRARDLATVADGLSFTPWLLGSLTFGAVSHLQERRSREQIEAYRRVQFGSGETPGADARPPDPAIAAIPIAAITGSALLGFAFTMAVVTALTGGGPDSFGRFSSVIVMLMVPFELCFVYWWMGGLVREMFFWGSGQHHAYMEARAAADRSRLAALQSQMQPHFLFNALNTVASLVRTDAPRAERVLADLDGMLTETLRRSEMLSPLADEIAFTRRYLDIEQNRFGSRLRVTYDVPQDLWGLLLPTMSLQPLVENAVKYAVNTSIDGGSIRIAAREGPLASVVTVEDDGPGFPAQARDGVGLANLRERLRTIYGPGDHLSIESAPGRTRVSLVLPFDPHR